MDGSIAGGNHIPEIWTVKQKSGGTAGFGSEHPKWRSGLMICAVDANTARMEFKAKLLRLIREKGLSQNLFAERFGVVSKSTVNNWCLGKNYPDLKEINELCKFFGVSPQYLCVDEIEEDSPDLLNEDERYILKVYKSSGMTADEVIRALFDAKKPPETGRGNAGPSSVVATQDTTSGRVARIKGKGKGKGSK